MPRRATVRLNKMSSEKPASKTGATIELLERRRLLSDTVFLPPVTSALPTGFQFQKLLTPSLNTEFEPVTDSSPRAVPEEGCGSCPTAKAGIGLHNN